MEQKMKRRDARNAAVQLVCAAGFYYGGVCDYDEIYENGLGTLEIGDNSYIRRLYYGVLEKYPELDGLIEGSLKGWKVSRLSKVTLAILRVAAYEIVYVTDLPFQIAINEAVEAAKTYDDEKSPKFVNGILNGIAEKTGAKERSNKKPGSGEAASEDAGR